MKNRKRALRRYHRERMIARSLKSFTALSVPEEDRLRVALRRSKNRQKCSCFMCGHRREWHGLTMQELRQLNKEKHDTEGKYVGRDQQTP